MPKTKISEYSTTNADNTDIESINIAEGCAPSGINNAIRELMVHLKEFQTGASGDGFTFAGGTLMTGTNTLSGTNVLSGSTTAAFAAGTVSAPSIYASGDTNTGIFFPAADTIAITEGGVEVARINSSGNVGIGTDSPGSKLDVKGTLRLSGSTSGYVGIAPAAAAGSTTYTLPSADGSSGQVLSTNGSGTLSWATVSGGGGSSITAGDSKVEVTDTGSNGTIVFNTDNAERMRINSSGRLLVGTTTARSDFFNTTTVVPRFQVELAASDNLNRFISVTSNNNDTGGGTLLLAKSRGTTVGAVTIVQNDDQIGSVSFQAADGVNLVEAARIEAKVDGTPGSDDMPASLRFYTTADGAASSTERMRISADGTIKTSSTISVGGATPSNSGAGITFPATQSASSNANTLDDYEEGTWTPTQGTFDTWTSPTFTATYTKVGRLVTICLSQIGGTIGWSAQDYIGGLPFTPSVDSVGYAGDNNPGSDNGYVLAYTNGLLYFQKANASETTLVLTVTYFV